MNTAHLHVLADIVWRHAPERHLNQTMIPAIKCSKNFKSDSGMPVALILNPCLCLIVQGAKNVIVGGEQCEYTAGDYIIAPFHLPLMWVITEGTSDRPYLCFQLEIDFALISELLMDDVVEVAPCSGTSQGLFKGKMDEELCEPMIRLAGLLDKPKDAPYLASIYMREIYYRLITSEHGRSIVNAAIFGSSMEKISRAVAHINQNFQSSLRMEELARLAGMSVSSFYQHFKAVTASSPLQYQKQLRLIEARRLMVVESVDAICAAHLVGYESPSQFNREYSRMFGTSPARDREQMRML